MVVAVDLVKFGCCPVKGDTHFFFFVTFAKITNKVRLIVVQKNINVRNTLWK